MEGSSRGKFHLSLLNGLLINRKKFEINHDKEIVLYNYFIFIFYFFKTKLPPFSLQYVIVLNDVQLEVSKNKEIKRLYAHIFF